ncbi:hypothetical protein [Micromonospora chokoriensis]|uniref:hypothetical protein n=1 Tax=Micromonospora chokoriensis TaxID=356851 RepID=UPI001E5AE3B4|nr:hypothetical protein [Micromonospora chokoriensis]
MGRQVGNRRGWLRVGLMMPLLGVVVLLGPLPMATSVLAAAPPSPGVSGQADVPASPAGVVASPGASRYYLVGAPRDGQREYLYQIAVQTLGDGKRSQEIFELNRGRLQHDNGRLTDPLAALQPGWVLELPADARGAAVHVGPLPLPSVTPSASAAPTSSRADGTSTTSYLIGIAGLMVAFLIVVVLWQFRGRRGSATPQPTTARPEAARPEPQVAAVPEPQVAALPAAVPAVEPPPVPVLAAEPTPTPVPAAVPTPVAPPAAKPAPVPVPVPAVEPPPAPIAVPAPVRSPSADSAPADTVPKAVDTAGVDPAPSVSAMWASGRAVVILESLAGDPPDRLDVRLMGAAADDAAGVPCGWLGDESLSAALMPFVLGRQGGRQFVVDLGATPDVFTVTGTPSAARRQARAMAEGLQATVLAVNVVGDVLGADLPRGWRRLDTFPTSQREIAMLPQPSIIVSAGLSGVELTSARELAARTDHRVIPVLVGEMMRTRWSVRVTEPKP